MVQYSPLPRPMVTTYLVIINEHRVLLGKQLANAILEDHNISSLELVSDAMPTAYTFTAVGEAPESLLLALRMHNHIRSVTKSSDSSNVSIKGNTAQQPPGDERRDSSRQVVPVQRDDNTQPTRNSSASSLEVTPFPSLPASGTQTPAACRPLMRRSTPQELQMRLERLSKDDGFQQMRPESSERNPDQYKAQRSPSNFASSTDASPVRYPDYDDVASRTRLPSPCSPRFAAPRLAGLPPRATARPQPPRRKVSHEVHSREQALKDEVEELRSQLKVHQDKEQAELINVQFALNRIQEQQKNQMNVQAKLLEQLAGMDLQAREAREAVRRAARDSRRHDSKERV